jgi:predicted RNA-binding Zn-ribbon protein involved in translation (DUF1610 family)
MPGIRLRVGDIHQVADRLLGTHNDLAAALRDLGHRPERINQEHLQQSPRFTASRCRKCGRWLSPWTYYNEQCPECGWTFMGRAQGAPEGRSRKAGVSTPDAAPDAGDA